MDGFLNKLDNLAYELFGIVLPGLVASVFLILLWIGLGSLPPIWSSGQVPTLTPDIVRRLIDRIPGALQTVTVICTLVVWYFLGHSVNWISKGRSHTRGEFKERVRRIWSFLKFRIQKPTNSFDPALRKLFEAVSREFSAKRETLQWREFYPLAKTHLVNTGRNSLLATYQNKYTLHRSIAAAAAASFWLSIVSICAAWISNWFGLGGAPDWLLLWSLAVASLVVVAGFSATFAFYWTLWGDTIVTESYGALFGPKVQTADGSDKRSHSS